MTAVTAVAALGLSAPAPIVFSGPGYSSPRAETIFSPTGITDERGFYFQRTGLLTADGLHAGPRVDRLMPWIAGMRARHPRAFVHYTIGMIGYYTGPDRHIIDRFALGDPLLARLPATRPWRIGHYARALPEGYVESVENATNAVADPDVRALYGLIREVTRGPIWSRRRWRAIWTLNTMDLPLD
jgi:arabinofuranosyltransferase